MDLRSSCSSDVEEGISMGAENAMVSETCPLQNTQVIEESVVIVNLTQSEQKVCLHGCKLYVIISSVDFCICTQSKTYMVSQILSSQLAQPTGFPDRFTRIPIWITAE